MSNLEKFLLIYKKNLTEQVKNNPQEYMWALSELDEVFKRMKSAIERNTFNKDSNVFKLTCKELNIKHTYKAISEFIK